MHVKEVILLNVYCKIFVAKYFTHIRWKKFHFKFYKFQQISMNSLKVSLFMTFEKIFDNKM